MRYILSVSILNICLFHLGFIFLNAYICLRLHACKVVPDSGDTRQTPWLCFLTTDDFFCFVWLVFVI